MNRLEPQSVQAVVQNYLDALDASGLTSQLYGVYLYGSVPLGGFDERTSDIDVIALTHKDLAPEELATLRAIHEQLAGDTEFGGLGKRLDVMYIPLRDLGKRNSEVEPYPYSAEGEFHPSGHFDLNGVAWWLVKNHGISLCGPQPEELDLATSWDDVMADMDYNLNTYWARQYDRVVAHKDDVRPVDDYLVLFTGATLCRILSTVEDHVIPTKHQAILKWRDRVPEKHRRILDETLRISRHENETSLYDSPAELRSDAVAFMQYAIERGNRSLAQYRANRSEPASD